MYSYMFSTQLLISVVRTVIRFNRLGGGVGGYLGMSTVHMKSYNQSTVEYDVLCN